MKIEIVYHDDEMPKLEFIDGKSDWIDLRAAKDYIYNKGDSLMIDLGVSMKLPDGYEAHVIPRSSTYRNFGLIQTNSMGIIDNSYCGTNDIWKFPAYAVRFGAISKYDRIAQFRIVKKQPPVEFEEKQTLNEIDRGGFGSTGTK